MIKLQSIFPIVLHQLYSHCIRKDIFQVIIKLIQNPIIWCWQVRTRFVHGFFPVPIGVVDDSQLFAIFSVIFITFWSSQGNLSSKKAGILKKNQRLKTCHDLVNVARFLRQNAIFWSWGKRVTIAKTWHDLVKP